jgi:Domain of unknown function (DUF4383)
MAKTIATILGAVFILVGLVGFIAPHLMGMHLSATHNIIHLVSGAASLYFGLAGSLSAARLFCLVFGAVYGLLGVAGFIFGSGADRILPLIPGAFEPGTMDHIVHVILGLAYLIGGLTTRADDRVTAAT